MAIIVTQTQTADNAYHIQDAFRRLDRDCYPLGVYEAIYDYINDTHGEDEAYHLDVIGWCSCINKTTLADLADLDMLADLATVLYVDYDTKTVYYLAY